MWVHFFLEIEKLSISLLVIAEIFEEVTEFSKEVNRCLYNLNNISKQMKVNLVYLFDLDCVIIFRRLIGSFEMIYDD